MFTLIKIIHRFIRYLLEERRVNPNRPLGRNYLPGGASNEARNAKLWVSNLFLHQGMFLICLISEQLRQGFPLQILSIGNSLCGK